MSFHYSNDPHYIEQQEALEQQRLKSLQQQIEDTLKIDRNSEEVHKVDPEILKCFDKNGLKVREIDTPSQAESLASIALSLRHLLAIQSKS